MRKSCQHCNAMLAEPKEGDQLRVAACPDCKGVWVGLPYPRSSRRRIHRPPNWVERLLEEERRKIQ